MQELLIQPEESELELYLELAKDNGFYLEIDEDILENRHVINNSEIVKGIHAANLFTFREIVDHINRILITFKPVYIIFHDDNFFALNKPNLMSIMKLLSENDILLLIENKSIIDADEFNTYLNSLRTLDANVYKCLDIGHINLSGGNFQEWFTNSIHDADIKVVHMNNNFGDEDTHNSLTEGSISTEQMTISTQSIPFISLELNINYDDYFKNIVFMLLNQIPPFVVKDDFMNRPFFKQYVVSRLSREIHAYFKDNVSYAFIYGSFAKGTASRNSDVDCFICLKSESRKLKSFVNDHTRLSKELGFVVDDQYPVEIFTNDEIDLAFRKHENNTPLSEDDAEIISAHNSLKIMLIGSVDNK